MDVVAMNVLSSAIVSEAVDECGCDECTVVSLRMARPHREQFGQSNEDMTGRVMLTRCTQR